MKISHLCAPTVLQLPSAFFSTIRITINSTCKPIKLFYYLAASLAGSFRLCDMFSRTETHFCSFSTNSSGSHNQNKKFRMLSTKQLITTSFQSTIPNLNRSGRTIRKFGPVYYCHRKISPRPFSIQL